MPRRGPWSARGLRRAGPAPRRRRSSGVPVGRVPGIAQSPPGVRWSTTPRWSRRRCFAEDPASRKRRARAVSPGILLRRDWVGTGTGSVGSAKWPRHPETDREGRNRQRTRERRDSNRLPPQQRSRAVEWVTSALPRRRCEKPRHPWRGRAGRSRSDQTRDSREGRCRADPRSTGPSDRRSRRW